MTRADGAPAPTPPDDDHVAEVLRRATRPTVPPLLPELVLHLTGPGTALWDATDAQLEEWGVPAPFWAFAWPGGQALARHVLDHPAEVAGRRVLDLAAGSGVCGVAAARAGAAQVVAADTDPVCAAVVAANAEANGVRVDVVTEDLLDDAPPSDVDVVLAGDVCYDLSMAARVVPWLRAAAGAGARVLLGDPRRRYLPSDGLRLLAEHDVATVPEVPDSEAGVSGVFLVLAAGGEAGGGQAGGGQAGGDEAAVQG